MLRRLAALGVLAWIASIGLVSAQSVSPNGVRTLNPAGAINPGTDTWSVGARAGGGVLADEAMQLFPK